jgi:hypothetical protein
MVGQWMSRPLDRLDIRVVMIDGLFLRDHCILIALGVASDGAKHVLGLREGSTENAAVARAMLSDLLDRGLRAEGPILFVIDGGKALRKAIGDLFGTRAVVQRCQLHKRRNVLDHLPESMQSSVRRAMQQAYPSTSISLVANSIAWLVRSSTSIPEPPPPCARGSTRRSRSSAWALPTACTVSFAAPMPSRISTDPSSTSRATSAAGRTHR